MYTCVCLMAVLHTLNAVEARVYCQDSHASSWVPFGYSCPILCQNIVNAIERLKIMDFENIIYHKRYKIPKKTGPDLSLKREHTINEIDTDRNSNDNTMVRTNMFVHRKMNNINNFKNKITKEKEHKAKSRNDSYTIDEKNFYKDVIKLTQLATKIFKGRCIKSKNVGLVAMMKCARKSNIDGSFLKIMTKLLNKYANSVYKFSEEMTEVLLEKIFGENTDLRNNIFDVNKLLGYLRQALHTHEEHENRDIIALSSKQCLTVSLPGCFCQSGFVESSGQCVRPSDCVEDSSYNEYLARLVVT